MNLAAVISAIRPTMSESATCVLDIDCGFAASIKEAEG